MDKTITAKHADVVGSRARRDFLKTSAKAAVAAPAASMLLAAHAKKASAQQIYDITRE